MSGLTRSVAGLFAAAGLLLTAAHVGAETATLELKRVDTSARPDGGEVPIEHLFRISRPQTVFQPLGEQAGGIRGPHDDDTPAFTDVIKKEPAEYATKTPLRGVVQLGSHHYGFVLDVAAPKEEEKEQPPAEKQEEERGGLFSALGRALTAPLARKPEVQSQAPNFTRLYFDLNRNGDLTDDGVIEAESARAFSPTSSRSTFPVVELTIDVDGRKVDYAFTLGVQVHASGNFSYAYASLHLRVLVASTIGPSGRIPHYRSHERRPV